jgi:Gas vesicle protein
MSTPARNVGALPGRREPAQLADVLERVLDKGIVIAGDIQINLLDIELLTIRLRLLVASADKAREMGIDWWEGDPFLRQGRQGKGIESRLKRLERAAGLDGSDDREQ